MRGWGGGGAGWDCGVRVGEANETGAVSIICGCTAIFRAK